MAEIIPEGDPRRAPKPRPISDFEQCEKCEHYHLKSEGRCFTRGCSNNPETKKSKPEMKKSKKQE